MTKGKFVTIEGIDGSGKSTVIERLQDHYGCQITAEPSPFWTGKQVRRALSEETPQFTDFFLFMADRQYHIEEFIEPNLAEGNMVISDRFHHSTLAYQKAQLEDHLDDPTEYMTYVMEPWNLIPDLTILLDVSIETGLSRCDKEEKYETREMLQKVQDNYSELFYSTPYMKAVDAEKPVDGVFEDCRVLIDNLL